MTTSATPLAPTGRGVTDAELRAGVPLLIGGELFEAPQPWEPDVLRLIDQLGLR